MYFCPKADDFSVSGEPLDDDSRPMTKEEEVFLDKEYEEEEEDIRKRSTQDKEPDNSNKDLGTEDKGVEKYENKREDEVDTAVKKPYLPFYCSIPLVSR